MVGAQRSIDVSKRGAHFASKPIARKQQIREFLASAERRYGRPIFAQKTAEKVGASGARSGGQIAPGQLPVTAILQQGVERFDVLRPDLAATANHRGAGVQPLGGEGGVLRRSEILSCFEYIDDPAGLQSPDGGEAVGEATIGKA